MTQTANLNLNIALCDDDAADRKRSFDLTAGLLTELGAQYQITAFDSATPLLSAIENGAVFHLLLLDVVMAETDGIVIPCKTTGQGKAAGGAGILLSGIPFTKRNPAPDPEGQKQDCPL